MTREEKLYSMTMKVLAEVAEAEGVKIDKKGSKQKAVEKILAFEAEREAVRAEEQCALSEPFQTEETEEPEEVEERKQEEEPQKETKKARKPRQKKEVSADVSALFDYIMTEWKNMGGIVKMPGKENACFRPLCAENGRQVVKLMWTTKKVSMFIRVETGTQYADKWQKINYAMPFQCMFFNDTEETRERIKNLFALVMQEDSIRKTKKEKKEKAA